MFLPFGFHKFRELSEVRFFELFRKSGLPGFVHAKDYTKSSRSQIEEGLTRFPQSALFLLNRVS